MSKSLRNRTLKLGTRGSLLALWQANWTKSAIERHHDVDVDLVRIKTTGDQILDVPLAEVGGKGLFTKELDEALLDGRVDLVVHSMKDLPYQLPPGILLSAVPAREDRRDALVSDGRNLAALPAGARIGTSSLRRQVQLKHRFGELDVVPLRGNVDTRLGKFDAGEYDGIILAAAGLKRLGHGSRITELLEDEVMLSAIGQGALALVCRSDDSSTEEVLRTLDHPNTHTAVLAERSLSAFLNGSCQVPIGGNARLDGDRLVLKGLIGSLDGTKIITDSVTGGADAAEEIGARLGRRLLASGGAAILDEISASGT